MPSTFQHSYDQDQSLTKFRCTLEIKSHQLIVSYEYTSTVASKLFNFAPTLSNLNVSEHLSNPSTCQCKESKPCCGPHGHVITGDLRVIENAKLRELAAKGPKYREPNRLQKDTETMFLNPLTSMQKTGQKENK